MVIVCCFLGSKTYIEIFGRYDLAHELHIPHDSEPFKAILAKIPCDDEWDPEINIEAGYLAAGLKRYSLCVRQLTQIKTEHLENNINMSSTSRDERQQMLTSSASGFTVEVKVEDPFWIEFKDKLVVLKSSENRMNTVRNSWEKTLANIKAQEDSSKEGLLQQNFKNQ